jgi:hypothetical protein
MVFAPKMFSLPAFVQRSLPRQNFKPQTFNIMKAENKNALRVITIPFAIGIALLSALLMTACQTKDGVAQTAGSAGTSAVKAPDIDIHTSVLTENTEALKQHIAAGTNINEKDPFGGSSPLISAALFGKTEQAKILIEAGADINFQNNDGSTALHVASFFGRPEIVKILLDKGADKSIKNKYGATPYDGVAGPFSEVKNTYDIMVTTLGPLGLKLDYAYLEKVRPEIAVLLK